jgi:Tfp pilus assembly protein PilF
MIICPILTQQSRDEDGVATWEHHECLKDGCSFWAAEAEDCSIRASGIQVLKESAAEQDKEAPAPIEFPDFRKLITEVTAEKFEILEQKLDQSAMTDRFDDLEKKLDDAATAQDRQAPEPIEFPDFQKIITEITAEKFEELGRKLDQSDMAGRFDELEKKLDAVVADQDREPPAPIEFPDFREIITEMTAERFEALEKKLDQSATVERIDQLEKTLDAAAMPRKFEDMEKRLDEIAEKMTAANRDLGIQLLEGVSSLEQPVHALRDELEEVRRQMQEMSGVTGQASEAIEGQRRENERRAKIEKKESAIQYNSRGLVLFQKGAVEAAEAAFRKAVELDPNLAEPHNNLGLTLGKLGRADEAVAAFEMALELKPELASVLNNLGFLWHEKMEFEKAAEFFRRAGLVSEDSSVALTNLGNALYRLGKQGDAVEAWKKAIEKDSLNEAAARALRMFEGAEVAV